MSASTARAIRLRWTAWCLAALAVFQLAVAALLFLNRERAVAAFTGHSFAPTRPAAESAVLGTLLVHVLLAALFAFLALTLPAGRRWGRAAATALLGYTAVGGVAVLFVLPAETYLSPIGVALALVALGLLWWPVRTP